MFEEGNPFSGLSLSTAALHPSTHPNPCLYTFVSQIIVQLRLPNLSFSQGPMPFSSVKIL